MSVSNEKFVQGIAKDKTMIVWTNGVVPAWGYGQHDTWIDCNTTERARRVAACWNACDGISTEELEAGAIQKLREQRDELLSALKSLEREFRKVFPVYYYAEPWAHDRNLALKFACAVIAKAEGSHEQP